MNAAKARKTHRCSFHACTYAGSRSSDLQRHRTMRHSGFPISKSPAQEIPILDRTSSRTTLPDIGLNGTTTQPDSGLNGTKGHPGDGPESTIDFSHLPYGGDMNVQTSVSAGTLREANNIRLHMELSEIVEFSTSR